MTGLIITGQVQVDPRFLSVPGDVCSHPKSLDEPHISAWKEWARQSKAAGGAPSSASIVQLAHPGRMSPAGAGNRPSDMQTLYPSAVPVRLGETWLDRFAKGKLLGVPKAMSVEEIDDVVSMFVYAAKVSKVAGFDGVQLHGAHGFLLSQFLSPHTNRREDKYGGDPERRMALLKRLIREIREVCLRPFCLGVKLNSADYMQTGGLQEEGLQQVKFLVECGAVDFAEISGGNAENKTSKLHNSFGTKSIDKAPVRSVKTRIREAFFTEFAEKVQALDSNVPIQLSGGFRSRAGMADAISSGVCDLIGLGRTVVLQPDLPASVLLNPDILDEQAIAQPHIIQGQWVQSLIPAKIIGGGLGIQFFYYNMRRLGNNLKADPNITIPQSIVKGLIETWRSGLARVGERLLQTLKFN